MDNSLHSKINELRIKTHEKQYDIIALHEIKPKNGTTPDLKNLQLSGYTLHTNNLELEDVRGTCIYVNNKYKSSHVKLANHNFEDSISVEISGTSQSKILVTCIYRSGSPQKAIRKDEEMYKLIKASTASPGYKMKALVGDFNLNRISWSPEPELPLLLTEDSAECKFVECIRDTFMYQHVTEATRYREGNRPTLDDLIFTSYENSISDLTQKAPLGKSDHVTLTCQLNTDLKPTISKKVFYNYNKADYGKMKIMLNKNWEDIFSGKSVQEISDILTLEYNQAVEECVPKIEQQNSNIKKPVWMDRNALRKVKRKYSSWCRYLNTKQSRTYQEYIEKRNESTKENKRARKEFEKKLAKECRTNPKATWKYMKSTNRVSTGVPNLKKPDGTFTSSNTEIADTLNQQYASVFTQEDINNMPNIPQKPLKTPELQSFAVTKEAVLKELKALKPNKSPGIDEIHPRVLKEVAEEIAEPITILLTKSLDSEELPKHWLQAVVTPIFKKGSKSLPENYRPVSLTCILCKLLEKLIVKQIIKHITENELENQRQHGFTKGKSTTTNLLEVLNVWTEALMHGVPVDVLYLDFCKAFDSVPHLRLLKQINSFGITGKASNWIKAFLSNRTQKVRVNGAESQWTPVVSGIPQGSILGPILFSLFVNDMPRNIQSLISLFADDTKIHLPLISDDSARQLQEDLWTLEVWSIAMQMKFHPKKCKVLHLGRTNNNNDYFMHTDDGNLHKLEETLLEKDLGVNTDSKLKFTEHCQIKINTATKVLRYIRHTFQHLDENIFLLLYKALVRPHLEYASCIWNPNLKYNIDSIERVQRRATKMVSSIKDLSYTDRLRKLNLETLLYRRTRADLLETYRIQNNIHTLDQNCHCSTCPDKHMFPPHFPTQPEATTKKSRSTGSYGPP